MFFQAGVLSTQCYSRAKIYEYKHLSPMENNAYSHVQLGAAWKLKLVSIFSFFSCFYFFLIATFLLMTGYEKRIKYFVWKNYSCQERLTCCAEAFSSRP